MNGRIVITALVLMQVSASAQDPKPLFIQVYSVKDLVTHLPESGKGPDSTERARRRTQALVRLIKDNVPLGEPSSITADTGVIGDKGVMIVKATRAEHEKVFRFLNDLRDSVAPQYLIDVAFIVVPPGRKALPEKGTKIGTSEGGDQRPLSFHFLKADAVEKVKRAGRVNAMPSMLVSGLKDAALWLGDTRNFVVGHEIWRNVEGYPAEVAIPRIKKVREGIDMKVFVIPSRKKDVVTLDLDLSFLGIVRPVAVQRGFHGAVYDVKTTTQQVKSTFTMPPGATVAISGLRPVYDTAKTPQDHGVVALITVRKAKRKGR